jgi:hypothetical protein
MQCDDLGHKNKIIDASTPTGFSHECFEDDATCEKDLAIIEALHSGIAATPEFRASLKQEFMAEARADAARHAESAAKMNKPASEEPRKKSGSKVRPLYARYAAVATAAIVIISIFTTNWLKPARPDVTQLADAPSQRNAASIEERQDELAYGEGNIRGMLAVTSDIKAMGFAPQAGDSAAAVEVSLKSALTDDSLQELSAIAKQAGGSVALSGLDAVASMSIPSEVLDHVLSNLDASLGIVDVSRPVEINTAKTCITLYFTAD